jgi:hypothetical protein
VLTQVIKCDADLIWGKIPRLDQPLSTQKNAQEYVTYYTIKDQECNWQQLYTIKRISTFLFCEHTLQWAFNSFIHAAAILAKCHTVRAVKKRALLLIPPSSSISILFAAKSGKRKPSFWRVLGSLGTIAPTSHQLLALFVNILYYFLKLVAIIVGCCSRRLMRYDYQITTEIWSILQHI